MHSGFDVTVMLLNYRRKEALQYLVNNLAAQTNRPELFLIDNSGEFHPSFMGMVDKYVFVPWNAGCFVRVPLARYASSEWIMFLDDDIYPRSWEFVDLALETAKEHPDVITGAIGREISTEYPYYKADVMEGYAHVVKGRFMLFRKALLDKVRMSIYDNKHDCRFLEDIFISLEIGDCKPVHFISPEIRNAIAELNPSGFDGKGISESPDHASNRNSFVGWYLHEWRKNPAIYSSIR